MDKVFPYKAPKSPADANKRFKWSTKNQEPTRGTSAHEKDEEKVKYLFTEQCEYSANDLNQQIIK